MMHQSARQAHALLENLLDWSRLQMGGLTSEPRPFDIAGAVKRALEFNTAGATGKNVAMVHHQGPLLTALADPNMVETILRNLIGNAVKFTEQGGAVAVEAVLLNGMIAVRVQDDGVGISSDRLAKLFNFETLASTTGTEGEPGTGLGLQLCKELAELQGGKISVESAAGQGSIFQVTLPSAI